MTARLSEIAQRLAAVKADSPEPKRILPTIFADCYVVPGKCIASSLPLAHLYSHAAEDLGHTMDLAKRAEPIIAAVVAGFTEDPGTSDLDNEQPIHVRMLLGEYRRARHLLHEMRKA